MARIDHFTNDVTGAARHEREFYSEDPEPQYEVSDMRDAVGLDGTDPWAATKPRRGDWRPTDKAPF